MGAGGGIALARSGKMGGCIGGVTELGWVWSRRLYMSEFERICTVSCQGGWRVQGLLGLEASIWGRANGKTTFWYIPDAKRYADFPRIQSVNKKIPNHILCLQSPPASTSSSATSRGSCASWN